MTRRSITEEARKRKEERDDSRDGEQDGRGEAEERTEGADDTDRRRFTQRMPEPLVGDIDEFADRHGMSRNAAINLLAKTGLESF